MRDRQEILERLDMLSKGSGLFCVEAARRSSEQKETLRQHPWAARLNALLHEAGEFGADWVYFRLNVAAGAPRAELFIYDWQGETLAESKNARLADLYLQLWNYGRVPLALILRATGADVYNLLPPPVFDENGDPKDPTLIECLRLAPSDSLALAGAAVKGIANSRPSDWSRFSARQFDTGAFWEAAENKDLATGVNSLDAMVAEMRDVRRSLERQVQLNTTTEKKNWFVRRLIIITLMVRFLEDRKILPADYFKDQDYLGAESFTSLLRHPRALLRAIMRLEHDFNGDVFQIDATLSEILSTVDPDALAPIANFAAGDMKGHQRYFWRRYSFRYLPVEVISYVYEDFLAGKSQAYFTPHHLVDLLLDEAMPETRILEALKKADPRKPSSRPAFRILDPACGSGVFLVGAWRRLVNALSTHEDRPSPVILKKLLTDNLYGVDIEKDSTELTIFSLCVALCSEFPEHLNQPNYVFQQLKQLKFPNLKLSNICNGDFFSSRNVFRDNNLYFDLIIGNPPFQSKIAPGVQSALDTVTVDEDSKRWCAVPDNQISYLFLRGVTTLLTNGGTACLVQPAGFIYNDKPAEFRKLLFTNWHVSQVLDFASIAGLFTTRKNSLKNQALTRVGIKTVAVFINRTPPNLKKPVLHATFRRTSVLNRRQVFEIDPQDLHWVPRQLASSEPRVWKANLLGGGRLLETYRTIVSEGTLRDFVKRKESNCGWVCSEGFNVGTNGACYKELFGKPFLKTEALTADGIKEGGIIPCKWDRFVFRGKPGLFEPPHLLIKEHEDLPVHFRGADDTGTLSFNKEIVGIKCPKTDSDTLRGVYDYIWRNRESLQMFLAFSPRYLIGRQTALLKKDIMDLPYTEDGKLMFRGVQRYLRDDVVEFMIPMIKDAECARTALALPATKQHVEAYAEVFLGLMQSVYADFSIGQIHDLQTGWCVSFHKGTQGSVAFTNVDGIRSYLDEMLCRDTGRALRTWRIVRHFSGNDVFILKPKPRRYWLKSAAVGDADQMFAWVVQQVTLPSKAADDAEEIVR